MLSGYREGKDIYRTLASQIYQIPEEQVTKAQRQFGKMGILGCGYGMGPDKFYQSCISARLVTTPEEAAQVVDIYRSYYEAIPRFWKQSEQALRSAFANPGKKFFFGRDRQLVAFRRSDKEDLQVRLPSNRILFYPSPHEVVRDGWSKPSLAYKTFMGTKAFSKTIYGGLIVENIVQAIARDLMAEAMLALDSAGFPLTMTVHDEIVAEVHPWNVPELLEAKGTRSLEDIMTTPPDWATDLPIEVEGYVSTRYRK